MKKLALILSLVASACFGQTSNLVINGQGTILNPQTVNFATGKLTVNGVAVTTGGVTTVTGTAPIVSSGGPTPAISITAATTGAAGSMSAADKSKLDGIAAGAQPGTVTSVAVSGGNGIGVSGSPITTSGTIALSLGAITPTSITASGAVSGTNLSGTNTGDQTSIVGITGTLAQFNTALTGDDFATGGGTATGTNTGDQTVPVNTTATASNWFSAYDSSTGAFTKSQPAFSDLSSQIGLAQISNGLITLPKLANMATDSLIYRKTAGTGAPEVNSLATLKTDLLLTGTNSGDQDLSALALKATTISTTPPLTGGGDLSTNRTFAIDDAAANGVTKGAATFTGTDFNATTGVVSIDYNNGQAASGSVKGFLTSADWTTFNGKLSGNQTITLSGDVTGSGATGITATIANDAVTYAKQQNVTATSRIIGRKTAGAGDPEELTFSEVLDFVSSAAQGDILYRNATAWVRLAAGADGDVLTTHGASTNPTWETPSGGGSGGVIGTARVTTDGTGTQTPVYATGILGSATFASNSAGRLTVTFASAEPDDTYGVSPVIFQTDGFIKLNGKTANDFELRVLDLTGTEVSSSVEITVTRLSQ